MKQFKVFSILILAVALIFCVSGLDAQIVTGSNARASVPVPTGPLVNIKVLVDSVRTDTSAAFTFAGYDAESFYDYPVEYGKKITLASGTPKVTVLVMGGFNSWSRAVVDTVILSDSVTTFGYGTINFNDAHFPKYWFVIKGDANNRSGTYLDLSLYARKKYSY